MPVAIADSIPALEAATQPWRGAGERIAFVPTMGALHAGHVSLVRQARALADRVIVSIFVNPTQFGPNEDFDRYPRTLAADCLQLEGLADLVFAPGVDDLYPDGPVASVKAGAPARAGLDDSFRPGHFDGVATVVARLFRLVAPHVAVFGEKDYQQLLVVRDMVQNEGLPVEIVPGQTVRESDGLAMSSRNRYLATDERSCAASIHAALYEASAAIRAGAGLEQTLEQARQRLREAGLNLEYVAARNADDLAPPRPDQRDGLRLLVAARLGATRLIDNLAV